VILVGYDDKRIYRQYYPLRNRAIQIGGAATLIIALMGGVWIQQRLRSAVSRRALVLTLDNMSQGIVMVDADGRVQVINDLAVKLLDLPPDLLLPGRERRRGEADHLDLPAPAAEGPSRASGQGLVQRGGRMIETFSQRTPLGGLVHTFTDVTERRIADARIRHMTHHDPLTGLANRTLLNDRIAELLRGSAKSRFGLISLDLDSFKIVNERLGHEGGDRMLRDMSRRLRELAGGSALLARIGGDEFAILCAEGVQPETTEALAKAIVAATSEPIEIEGIEFQPSVSLGFAFSPENGTTAVELIKHAEIAMYQAKARGRGRAVRFDAEMDRDQREHALLERDLRRAVRNHELEVWFQPRFELQPRQLSGFEALARWRHPERGLISPAQFIPVAEQCGLIFEIGMHVLDDACAFAASLPNGRIAVNLSPVQFLANDLATLIAEALSRNHLTPDRLELEITEGVLIADETQALNTLKRLHELGLQLALDDFGTGYASLSYLRRFPFDRIKIDQSFVLAQEHDATTRAIIESILAMARRLRLEVTAEGVETQRQLDLLIRQRCPEVQGYFLGRPMPATDALAFRAAQSTVRPFREELKRDAA
jgi:diguanylate cyclase (GGDEF)-like protein